jgi:hypothetical protein
MYDRDILALQVGASLTPADTYLIQLLHKFNLLEWVRYGFNLTFLLILFKKFVDHQKMVIHQMWNRKLKKKFV